MEKNTDYYYHEVEKYSTTGDEYGYSRGAVVTIILCVVGLLSALWCSL